MIADISQPFEGEVLSKKIDYQLEKIDNNKAYELYNSIGVPLKNMHKNMCLVQELNDRVKLPFLEFVISLNEGENIPDDKLLELSQDYIQQMGYDNSVYSIIRNTDTDNPHVHILATTIDMAGVKISDSKNWKRSYAISRELEKKYNLKEMQSKGFSKMTLGESQYRKYFFDSALKKSLRNYKTKDHILSMLSESEMYEQIKKETLTNEKWQLVLGPDLYDKVGEELYKNNFFNTLLKDELLKTMDNLYPLSGNVSEFRKNLEKEGYYMRLVSNKGHAHYVYGIPEFNFYIKDKSLPQKYRYGFIAFDGNKLNQDEQKHYLYNQLFSILNNSSNYIEFKLKTESNNIQIIEHTNKSGIYGLSFILKNVEDPVVFKSSEISGKLTYKNIQAYFDKNNEIQGVKEIERILVGVEVNSQNWNNEINYISGIIPDLGLGDGKLRKTADDEYFKKPKKKGRQLNR